MARKQPEICHNWHQGPTGILLPVRREVKFDGGYREIGAKLLQNPQQVWQTTKCAIQSSNIAVQAA